MGRGRLGNEIFFLIIAMISNDLAVDCSPLSTSIESNVVSVLASWRTANGLASVTIWPSRRLCPICRVGFSCYPRAGSVIIHAVENGERTGLSILSVPITWPCLSPSTSSEPWSSIRTISFDANLASGGGKEPVDSEKSLSLIGIRMEVWNASVTRLSRARRD
jgi:hypothetical protein